MDEDEFEVYPGGSSYAHMLYERRRSRMRGVEPFGVPPSDVDLAKALTLTVRGGENYRFQFLDEDLGGSDVLDRLSGEFSGKSEIELLHANCIANLRRRKPTPNAKLVFFRLWAEHDAVLLDRLPPRWLISAMATFGDHGETATQRYIGNIFNVFFGMFKLYEFERRISQPSRKYRRFPEGETMPLGLAQFGLNRGDLDINLLARMHVLCSKDRTVGLIGGALLYHLNKDKDTVFSRLKDVKDRKFLMLE